MWRGEVARSFVRESLLAENAGAKIRCNVCERRCRLVPGGLGWCRTRQNRAGTLVTLIYGAVSSLAANPIEKKPFFHFHPGARTLTAGSWSCNFGCPWCQNWTISKAPPPFDGEYFSPERFIKMVEEMGCEGTSISFNEPTLSLEWSLDVFRLSRKRGFYNTYVTNGYETPWVSVKGREYSVRGNVAFPTILGFPALGRTELEIFTRCERTLVLSASSAGPYSRSGSEIHTIWGRGSSGVHSEIVDIRAFRRSKHLLEDLFERASRGYE